MCFFKKISFVSTTLFLLSACTDYVAEIDEQIDELEATIKDSSDSGSVKSSSSIAKSSSSLNQFNPDVKYGESTDSRNGLTFMTVKIGSQMWMAENLNFDTDSSFCYNNEERNCTKYGRLYSWAAAVGKSERECGYGNTCSLPSGNIQGICPSGWHLPSKTEWETLFNFVGGQTIAGKVLKSTSGWFSGLNGTDAFGFSALPTGDRGDHGNFNHEDSYAYFWSSTESSSRDAYRVFLPYSLSNAFLDGSDKYRGFSVRCIQDEAPEKHAQSSSSEKIELSSSSSRTAKSSSSTAKSSSSAIKSSSSISSSSVGRGLEITPDRVGPVSQYGQLVTGKNAQGKGRIYGSCDGVKDGAEVQVRGMSLYWSLVPNATEFWTPEGISTMVRDMNIQIVRAAMATGNEDWWGCKDGSESCGDDKSKHITGYASDSEFQANLMKTVVEAAIKNDIYVIIDWHSHNANEQTESAKTFFKEMAQAYGQYDNVIFELFNEPTDIPWSVIKNYADQVVPVIRQYSDNLILVGNRQYDQNPQDAIGNTVSGENIAYTFHYYANTHCWNGQTSWGTACEGANAQLAIDAGLSVFVSEWGTGNADGGGVPDQSKNTDWQNWVDDNKLSWANWSASYVSEGTAAFQTGSSRTSLKYTTSGNLVKGYLASNPKSYTACQTAP